jgi:hypothetical protein
MSISKRNAVSIAVTRATRTSDGAGGYTSTLPAISGSPFAGRKIRIKRPVLIDASPGDVSIDLIVLVFDAGTDIRVDDICTIGSKAYRVTAVREYTRSVQADVELDHTVTGTVTVNVQTAPAVYLAGVLVSCAGRSAITDAGGDATITTVPVGSQIVVPSMDTHVFTPASSTVTVFAGQTAHTSFIASLG